MASDITISREGLILTCGCVGIAFIAVLWLGLSGQFCPKAKVAFESKTDQTQTVKQIDPVTGIEADPKLPTTNASNQTLAERAKEDAAQKEDDHTTLYLQDDFQILYCFDPINGYPRLKFHGSIDDVDKAYGPFDAFKNNELEAKLYFTRNVRRHISGIELKFARDSRTPISASEMARLKRLETAWQQMCSTVDIEFDGKATQLFEDVYDKPNPSATYATHNYKIAIDGKLSDDKQFAIYSLTITRAPQKD